MRGIVIDTTQSRSEEFDPGLVSRLASVMPFYRSCLLAGEDAFVDECGVVRSRYTQHRVMSL